MTARTRGALICALICGQICALDCGPLAVAVAALPGPAAAASREAGQRWEWRLPPGFPPPPVPADNPMSPAKVELGRRLFYDVRLSGNGTLACAGCHRQELAFTDGRARAVGSTGELHALSAMSLANVAYGVRFNWADAATHRLESQALVPMLNRRPVELGLAGRELTALQRLAADGPLRRLFRHAFPGERRTLSLANVRRALAAFQRTLLSGDSAYDRYLYHDEDRGFPPAAKRGHDLFFGERTRCAACHGGFNLSGPVVVDGTPPPEPTFHNTGLYNVDRRGGYPEGGRGLYERTGRREDMGRFRAPTLRNIALTAPYMHDGSVATLGEVIDHYAAGGRGDAGAGTASPWKSPLVAGFEITAAERADLVAFLETLTDRRFVTDPALADPALGDPAPGDLVPADLAPADFAPTKAALAVPTLDGGRRPTRTDR